MTLGMMYNVQGAATTALAQRTRITQSPMDAWDSGALRKECGQDFVGTRHGASINAG